MELVTTEATEDNIVVSLLGYPIAQALRVIDEKNNFMAGGLNLEFNDSWSKLNIGKGAQPLDWKLKVVESAGSAMIQVSTIEDAVVFVIILKPEVGDIVPVVITSYQGNQRWVTIADSKLNREIAVKYLAYRQEVKG